MRAYGGDFLVAFYREYGGPGSNEFLDMPLLHCHSEADAISKAHFLQREDGERQHWRTRERDLSHIGVKCLAVGLAKDEKYNMAKIT